MTTISPLTSCHPATPPPGGSLISLNIFLRACPIKAQGLHRSGIALVTVSRKWDGPGLVSLYQRCALLHGSSLLSLSSSRLATGCNSRCRCLEVLLPATGYYRTEIKAGKARPTHATFSAGPQTPDPSFLLPCSQAAELCRHQLLVLLAAGYHWTEPKVREVAPSPCLYWDPPRPPM